LEANKSEHRRSEEQEIGWQDASIELDELEELKETPEVPEITQPRAQEGKCDNNHNLIKIHIKELGPLADEILGFVQLEDAL